MIRKISALLAAAGVSCSVACATTTSDVADNSDSGVYEPPAFVSYSTRWSGLPGVELTEQPAISVRAFFESAYLASNLSPVHGYPGFAEQVSPRTEFGVFNIAGFKPEDIGQITGTQYMHIARLSFNSAAAQWDATVCTWSNGLTQTSGTKGQRVGGGWKANMVTPATIRLQTPDGDAATGSHVSGHGPARYPVTDVFGEWETVEATYYEGSERATCEALTDTVLPSELRHIAPADEYRSTPLPTLPPYPGWSTTDRA